MLSLVGCIQVEDGIAGCSITQNSASVFLRGYLNSASVYSILPRDFSMEPEFCLGNLDLPSKLPRVSTLMLHPGIGKFYDGICV